MKRSLPGQLALAALILLVGGAIVWRAALRPSSAPLRTAAGTTAEPSALPEQGSVPKVQDTPAANLALRIADLLSKQDRRTPGEALDELAKSQDRDILLFAQQLSDLLRRDPSQWRAVFDLLDSGDTLMGPRIAALIRPALDDANEGEFIGSLQSAPRRETRLLAISFLVGRPSNESLSALMTSTQSDPDHGVRFMSLRELAMRQAQVSPETAAKIDDLIRQRAQVDPSPEVRNSALRMTGQPVAGDRPAPKTTRAPAPAMAPKPKPAEVPATTPR